MSLVAHRVISLRCGIWSLPGHSGHRASPYQSGSIYEHARLVMEAGLPIVAPLWEDIQVKRSIHLCRLLALFLIVGLVFAPLSAPATAATTASMAAASMSDDMPCCPEKSAPVDCDKCLLMAICMAKTFQALPSAGVIDVQPVAIRKLSPHSDPEAESLAHPPPPRPPRSLVRSA